VKQLESVEKLPLNINVLYEVVERDDILKDVDFEDEDELEEKLCNSH
jgi:hypothetical protein